MHLAEKPLWLDINHIAMLTPKFLSLDVLSVLNPLVPSSLLTTQIPLNGKTR